MATAISVWLLTRKSAFAFLAGIVTATLIGWAIGLVKPADHLFSAPDFHTVFLKLDILGALKLSLLPAIIGILFTDLFDSISTFIGVAHAAELLDEQGNPKNLKQGLIVGRRRDIHPMMFALAVVSIGLLLLEHVRFP